MPVKLLAMFARLPLTLLHGAGYLLGLVIYTFSRRTAQRLRDNLRQSGLPNADTTRLRLHAAMEAGASITELFKIWGRPFPALRRHIRQVEGWEAVMALPEDGRGIILLSPHLGCFELLGQFVGHQRPFTALYRPPRQAALEPLMLAARSQGQASLAPTSMAGVRALLKALRRGEVVGILPDQVPPDGEGVWADFFGRPAYTMTLVGKLQAATAARVVLASARRLSWGRGYVLSFAVQEDLPEGMAFTAEQINGFMEQIIARFPAQYLWSYNRYKKPGARDAAIR